MFSPFRDILELVYDKGYAAWRTGHRVGAGPEQWGYARVHSFLTLGCTTMSADAHLLKKAAPRMAPAARRRLLSQPVRCAKAKLARPYYRRFGMAEWVREHRRQSREGSESK